MNRCCMETAARVSGGFEEASIKFVCDSIEAMRDLSAGYDVRGGRIKELETALRLFTTWMNEDGTGEVMDNIALKELMGIHNIYKILLEK